MKSHCLMFKCKDKLIVLTLLCLLLRLIKYNVLFSVHMQWHKAKLETTKHTTNYHLLKLTLTF